MIVATKGNAVKDFEAERREPSGIFRSDEPEGSRPTATIARFCEEKILHDAARKGTKYAKEFRMG